MQRKQLYIIDGHALIYRAYYAFIKHPLRNSKGANTSAVFGFTRMLLRLIKRFDPQYLLVAFDPRGKTFRHEMFPEYKAQRKKMPDDLIPQVDIIKDTVRALNIRQMEVQGFEADDVIGTMAKKAAAEDADVFIISKDKDLSQLISGHVKMLLPNIGGDSTEDFTLIDAKNAPEQFIVSPDKVIELLALMGDASDNIPGVPGVGPKSAQPLLEKYGDLDAIYKNIETIKPDGLRKKLIEGKDSAYQSRILATIRTDLELDMKWDEFLIKEPDKAHVTRIFEENNIKSLFKDMEILASSSRGKYETILTVEALQDLAEQMNGQKVISLDLETEGLDFLNDQIIGMSFSWRENSGYYVAFQTDSIFNKSALSVKEGLDILRPVLEDETLKKVGQNIKFDMLFLQTAGVEVKGVWFDTMLASFLLNPSEAHNMDDLAESYLGYKTVTYDELTGTGKNRKKLSDVPLEKLAEYAAEDADVTFRLYRVFEPRLRETGLDKILHEIDIPMMIVLAGMERNGVLVDEKYLGKLSKEFAGQLSGLEKNIFSEAGGTFNVNSTKQLQAVLFEKLKIKPVKKTKTSFSTDNSVLEELARSYPIAQHLLEYRGIAKLKNTYSDSLPELINAKTGRIHTSYNQTIAATGRLSSTVPNLQNIPVKEDSGRRIRNAFIAPKGSLIMSADYSQIELRLLAHISKDPELIRTFKTGGDIHAATARQIYGLKEDQEVSGDQRRTAKVINFGVIYGMGPFNLSHQLGISTATAKEYIDEYFRKYSGITEYYNVIRAQLADRGYVENVFGRRRYFPGYSSLGKREQEAVYRMAINTPVQGTAADLIKIAMIHIAEELKEKDLASKMIIQIHDELVFEVPEEEVKELTALVRDKMDHAAELIVPLAVDIRSGKNWAEAH